MKKIYREWGKLKQDGTLKYAGLPLCILTHVHEERTDQETGETIVIDRDDVRWAKHPTPEDYREAGYYPVLANPAPSDAPGGYHYEFRSYELVTPQGGTPCFERQYALVADPPPPPRRWSRLSIKTALAQAEMLTAARQYLSAVEIATGYTAWEALTDCDYIEEGYPDATRWNALLDGAAQALGKTRVEIDQFLAAIPTEDAQ